MLGPPYSGTAALCGKGWQRVLCLGVRATRAAPLHIFPWGRGKNIAKGRLAALKEPIPGRGRVTTSRDLMAGGHGRTVDISTSGSRDCRSWGRGRW